MAVMVSAATALQVAGWTETSLPAIVAGFGGTMLIIWTLQNRLFRAMIERHDAPGEGAPVAGPTLS